jgi:hypothetical protein
VVPSPRRPCPRFRGWFDRGLGSRGGAVGWDGAMKNSKGAEPGAIRSFADKRMTEAAPCCCNCWGGCTAGPDRDRRPCGEAWRIIAAPGPANGKMQPVQHDIQTLLDVTQPWRLLADRLLLNKVDRGIASALQYPLCKEAPACTNAFSNSYPPLQTHLLSAAQLLLSCLPSNY